MTYLDTGAQLSPCGKYRYTLWRVWDETLPMVAFVGLNPSTADRATSVRPRNGAGRCGTVQSESSTEMASNGDEHHQERRLQVTRDTTNDWCAEPQWPAATEYRVEFSLSCGWVIVNPQGVESMLGHARREDADREAAALNAQLTKGASK